MSTPRAGQRSPEGSPLPGLAVRLGYLLKHAQLRLAQLTASALAPFGISGRECGVLTAIDEYAPLSQQEVAHRMEVDRTTMVALIDDLERKGLVLRRQDSLDRRKNVVALTDVGRRTLRQATKAAEAAEEAFLGPLSDDESASLKEILRSVTFSAPKGDGRRLEVR